MNPSQPPRPVVLTGDRTTGPLHVGHYAGSLRNRLVLQETHQQFLLLADAQALTDNGDDPARVRRNVLEVALDYLAVGIDPARTTICLQSALPVLPELTMLYMNLVTVSRLERNPTIKDEIRQRGFERDIPAGFLCYPVAQAAGNALPLSAGPDEIRTAVRRMFTDPGHLRAEDPGRVEGNVVFTWLDAFDEDLVEVDELKAHYRAGGLGDSVVKHRLEDILQALLAPIRERRRALAADLGHVASVLRAGTERAREVTGATLAEVRDGIGLFSLDKAA